MKIETKHTFCRICESLCGLEVDIQNDKVIDIRPNKDHLTTYGFACPKGLKQHKMYDTPDRLKYPLAKKNGKWERVEWEQSMKEIGGKVKSLIKEHGPNSIGMYVGTAAGFSALHPIFAQGFMDGIGSNNTYSSATQDCSNKFAVSDRMYGYPFTLTFPDIENTDFLIIVGANPMVSKWSFLQVPNPSLHIKNIINKGGKVVVVDPRKTETAKVAQNHLAIRPNSDIFFYLSFLHEIMESHSIDKKWLNEHTKGFDKVISISKKWPAERTSKLTGISPGDLRSLVSNFMNAPSAAIYCSTGVNMGTYGSMSYWIQECINCISGNLDKKGGMLVSKGIIDFPSFGKKNGKLVRNDISRLHNFHSTNDAFPGGLLADEILTPGKGQIKALFVTGGNPLITMANSNRLREAFDSLELLVTLDIYPNETGVIGDYILPCTSPLQRPDLPFIFPLMLGLQTKRYIQATEQMVSPEEEQRDEASIYMDLARHSGVSILGSKTLHFFLRLLVIINSFFNKRKFPTLPQKMILNLILRSTGNISFKKLLRHKNGLIQEDHQPGSFVPDRILTKDKLIDLAPDDLLSQTEELEHFFESEIKKLNGFKLITKRDVTTHNSWTHNIEEFTVGDRYSNYAYLHSSDAKELKVEFKDLVKISSPTGSIVLPIKMNDNLSQKTVAVPHGWGHQSTGMIIAKKTSGVNVNILAADGIENVEKISGMSQLTGIDVIVEKYDGEISPDSWSGLEEDRHLVEDIIF